MIKKQKFQDLEYQFPYHYIASFFPNFTQTKSWRWGINYGATLEFILSKLKADKYKKVLDLGSGDGRLVMEISKNFPKKFVVGIDYSKKAVNLAKALFPDGNFVQKDIISGTIKGKYNAITLIEVLEHIPPKSLGKFLEKSTELLKKDGDMLITVPHTNMKVQKKHFQHFDLDKLTSYLGNGLRVKKVKYLGKQGYEYQLILKLLENGLFILNNKFLLNKIYSYYKRYLFICKEKDCSRIYVKVTKV